MRVLEVVFGYSCYFSMKQMKKIYLNNNDKILKFNTIFCTGDLSKIADYIIDIPDDLKHGDYKNSDIQINENKV